MFDFTQLQNDINDLGAKYATWQSNVSAVMTAQNTLSVDSMTLNNDQNSYNNAMAVYQSAWGNLRAFLDADQSNVVLDQGTFNNLVSYYVSSLLALQQITPQVAIDQNNVNNDQNNVTNFTNAMNQSQVDFQNAWQVLLNYVETIQNG